MIREIIVVEGKSDTAAIKRAVEADTLETGGSALNEEILAQIRFARERRGVIIFTDPDHAGERIRNAIAAAVPGCKHAFLSREEACGKEDIGIEHASPEAIRKALMQVRTEGEATKAEIQYRDLAQAGLVHRRDAAKRRLAMGTLLGIGYGNGKQFLKRCRMFGITRAEFEHALGRLEGDE